MSAHRSVTARIFGGLGNQLFMYAFARRMTLDNSADLVLDTTSGFVRDPFRRNCQLAHFHVAGRIASPKESFMDSLGVVRRAAIRNVNRWLPLRQRWYLQERMREFDPEVAGLHPLHSVYVEGYWQCAEYVEPISDVLREDFAFRWRPSDDVRRLAGALEETDSVCVHVRRYLPPSASTNASFGELPTSYYDRAITLVREAHPRAVFRVFTESANCRTVAHLLSRGCSLMKAPDSPDRDIADFWLMTRCRHFVVANSTYSWWAAWLGNRPGKLVVAMNADSHTVNTGFTTPAPWIRIAARITCGPQP